MIQNSIILYDTLSYQNKRITQNNMVSFNFISYHVIFESYGITFNHVIRYNIIYHFIQFPLKSHDRISNCFI